MFRTARIAMTQQIHFAVALVVGDEQLSCDCAICHRLAPSKQSDGI
jgi:hypothetical protein